MKLTNRTILDLELLDDRRIEKSVFSVFGRTTTKGGRELLNKLFRTPVSDLGMLLARKEEINFFYKNEKYLKLNSKDCDFIEHYLNIRKNPLHKQHYRCNL